MSIRTVGSEFYDFRPIFNVSGLVSAWEVEFSSSVNARMGRGCIAKFV